MAYGAHRPSITRVGGRAVVVLCTLLAASTAGATAAVAKTSRGASPSPLSNGVQAAMAFHAGTLRPTGRPAGVFPAIPANMLASNSGGQPVNDAPMVTSPTNASHLITAGNDYNCFGSGTGNIGVYGSSTSGSSYTHTCLALTAGFSACGDPAIAYNLAGTLYASDLECNPNPFQAVIAKSTNNGATFAAPTVAVTPLFAGGLIDKEWLQIDTTATSPHANNLYLSSTQFDPSNGSEIAVAHSSNGGVTWTNVGVSGLQTFPTVDQFSDLAITKTGTIYVSWMRCTANGPTGDCGGTTAKFLISKSSTGGASWSAPVQIGTVAMAPDSCGAFYGCLPNTNERMSNIPAIGVDNSAGAFSGRVYATGYTFTGTQMQVEVFTGISSGTVWGAPVKVGVITQDQFLPWLSISHTGVVGVSWLDRRRDPANFMWDTFAALSSNGGASFGTNRRISSVQSNPNSDGFGDGFMGDYTGNDWAGKNLHIAWPDTRNGVNCQDETATLTSLK